MPAEDTAQTCTLYITVTLVENGDGVHDTFGDTGVQFYNAPIGEDVACCDVSGLNCPFYPQHGRAWS